MGIAINQLIGDLPLRPQQAEIIDCATRGHSCLAILPTGYGKSLCYQAAAINLGKTSIVVSPLIALMQDQVNFLVSRGIPAARFDSSLEESEKRSLLETLRTGSIRLLYVAPESLENPDLADILSLIPLGLFIVDEAHCVSQWGHSFRPDYLGIPQIAQQYPFHASMVLTATATPRVCQDLAEIFHISANDIFKHSPQRENIERSLQFCSPEERDHVLLHFLKNPSHRPALLYCRTRNATEELATKLLQQGYKTCAYHAGLPSELRAEIQDNFLTGSQEILVATTAFGMGIDKPDIRSVVHYHSPDCLEAYLQESGRAGRDGFLAHSLVFLCAEDKQATETRILAGTPDLEGIKTALKHFFRSTSPLLSLWELSDACDLSESAIARILFDLKMREELSVLQRFPKYFRVKPLFSLENICHGREKSEIQVLTWLNEHRDSSIDELADVLDLNLSKSYEWLMDLSLSGEWNVQLRQKALLLQRQTPKLSLDELAFELYTRYKKQSEEMLKRFQLFWDAVQAPHCINQAIGNYFGFPLKQNCDTCSTCKGILPPSYLPALPSFNPNPELLNLVQQYAHTQPKALKRPEQWARFLLGITSPSSLRNRLWKQPLYGSFSESSWSDTIFIINSMRLI